MFLGQQQYTLDSKARLTIPAKYREYLAPALVVTRYPGVSCLLVMPMAEWLLFTEKINNRPMSDPNAALLRRMLYSGAEDLRLDGQGRILISQRLRDYAHIESDVLIAGMNNYFELWNPDEWNDVERQFDENEEVRRAFAEMGV